MAHCKRFCLSAASTRRSFHHHRLLLTFLHRPICHRPPGLPLPCLHRKLQSLTVDTEGPPSALESETLTRKSSSSLLNEDASLSVLDDDDDDDDDDDKDDSLVEDESEGELVSAEDNIEELQDLVSEDDEAGDDEGPAPPSRDSLLGKADIYHRVQELCLRIQREKDGKISARDLCELYNFQIDKFQRLAIEGFLKGSSVVVCAPTSSGKTLIAECAAAASLAVKRRLFYTTPLKALSNQKLREFRKMFGEENVGLITGDAAVNRDAPLLIMTTEILRNMLYQSLGTLEEGDQLHNVCAVVLDEVHYLSDISRGTVWEEVVIYCPKEVQLICLSATVANPDELADWIAQVHGPTELVTSKRRPVPLTWHFSRRYSLSPLLGDGGTAMNRRLAVGAYDYEGDDYSGSDISLTTQKAGSKSKRRGRRDVDQPRSLSNEELQFLRRRQIPRVEETLKQLKSRGVLPAIWFIFSRKGCDTAIQYVEDMQLLSDEEERQVFEALTTFRKQHPDAVRESSVSSLLCGFASHHAGCLPLWKGFIEELFQRGLIKVVFATETLAAGINMPARATVLSSLSKRGDAGHALLSSNAMLQMAGRAGRRGLDKEGHVVLVQTPFEGAEEACKILFAGPDPLVSQFAASYGMVLNLLSSVKAVDGKVIRHGRTLEEARALVERSFGNYVGNEVKASAMKEISKLEMGIAKFQEEKIPDFESLVTAKEIDEYRSWNDKLLVEKDRLNDVRSEFERKKVDLIQPLLEDAVGNKHHLTCVQICYINKRTGSELKMSALCIDTLRNFSFNQEVSEDQISEEINFSESVPKMDVSYFVALGFDNLWYAFSAISLQSIKKLALKNAVIGPEEGSIQDLLAARRPEVWESSWKMLAKPGRGSLANVWSLEGSYETSSLIRNAFDESQIIADVQFPEEISQVADAYVTQRRKCTEIKKKLKATKAFKEFSRLAVMNKLRDKNVKRLEKKRSKLVARVQQMQPTGWQEFLQVVNALERANALSSTTHEMLQLGKTAASVRGVNELWLALALSEDCLRGLNSAQLASVCGSLVTEGIKTRAFDVNAGSIYKPSSEVQDAVDVLQERREWLLELQHECGVAIACDLDDQLAGFVEAWASGVTWRELMMECALDEGDLARLLRRTIDLLAQVPLLPNLDPGVQKIAAAAADLMDRSPISELIA